LAVGRFLASDHAVANALRPPCNAFGQLGNGTMISSDTPARVKIPAGLIASALAACPTTRHSLAIVHRG
jgi:hypothetical protein